MEILLTQTCLVLNTKNANANASTLGLSGGLIRQRKLNDQSNWTSDSFKIITQVINNHYAITGLPRNGTSSSYIDTSSSLSEAKEKIRELQCLLGNHKPNQADEKSLKRKERLSKKA